MTPEQREELLQRQAEEDEASDSNKIIKTECDLGLEKQLEEVVRISAAVTKETEAKENGLVLSKRSQIRIRRDKQVKSDYSKAISKTRQIILMMVYDEMHLSEIAPVLGFSLQMIQIVASSPLFRAELQREMAKKQKLYRDGAISDLADKVVGKFKEVVEHGEMVFLGKDGLQKKIFVNGRDFIDMSKTILEMSGHGQEQRVVHDHSSLSDAIVKAQEEIERADNEKKEVDGQDILEAEIIENIDQSTLKQLEEIVEETPDEEEGSEEEVSGEWKEDKTGEAV